MAETTAEAPPESAPKRKRKAVTVPNGTVNQTPGPSPAALVPVTRRPIDIYHNLASHGGNLAELRELLTLEREHIAEQARILFAVGMNECQKELPDVIKDALNVFTKTPYARLETIHRLIKPVYTRHGFSITWTEGETQKPGHVRVVGDLMHTGGHVRRYHLDLPCDGSGAKGGQSAMNATQAVGSTVSYGRRYVEVMMFDLTIAGEDRDGNNPFDTLTADQIAEVTRTFKTAKACYRFPDGRALEWDGFLHWLGVKSIEEADQKQYADALADLNTKIANAAARAAAKAAPAPPEPTLGELFGSKGGAA